MRDEKCTDGGRGRNTEAQQVDVSHLHIQKVRSLDRTLV